MELFHDERKHEFALPLTELKSRLRTTGEPNIEQEPPIRRQLLLAHQVQQILDKGQAKDLQQIAGWLSVSKSRLDQITNLLYLCPKIQEGIITGDRFKLAKISERSLRLICRELYWEKQVRGWAGLLALSSLPEKL